MINSGATENEVIDWENFLDNFADEVGSDLFDDPSTAANGMDPFLSIEDVEQYLMNDESNGDKLVENRHDDLTDEFLSDLLLDSPHGSGLGSDLSKNSSASPDSGVIEGQEEEEREEDSSHEKDDVQHDESKVVDVGQFDDPVDKKRKRQIRNRDAAVRSRERKKMYLRDLELKSKYYEAECKRLGTLLQCCLAENQALQLSMHNSKAFDASMNKQESAVLLLESLLLGSLLGVLGITYLLILGSQFLSNLEMALHENVGNEEWESGIPRKVGMEARRIQPFDLFMMGKGCKASRSRMRFIMIIELSSRLLSRTPGGIPVFSLVG